MKAKLVRNHIYHLINEDGKSVTDLQSIKSLAPAYYEQLFNQDSYWNVFPEAVVKKKLTREAANWISRDVSSLEIKTALLQMHPDKAPGSDGYNAHFFQKNWDLVGDDICRAIQSFIYTYTHKLVSFRKDSGGRILPTQIQPYDIPNPSHSNTTL